MKWPQYEPAEGIVEKSDFFIFLINSVKTEKFPIQIKTEYGKEISYYNIPAAFDIETTSFYNRNGEKCGCMYIWTLGIYNTITTGRTWQEFKDALQLIREVMKLDNDRRLVIYVHNLGFEFQFMRRQLTWDKCFFLDSRKPIYCLSNGIEFRDSLKLSNKSLANTAKDIILNPIEKMVGDLDYSLPRHSRTPINSIELKYCENDVRILLHYIYEKIQNDNGIANIPLTNTGYVRNYCRRACYGYGKHNYKWAKYRRLIESLTLTPRLYKRCKDAYQGGFTHASPSKLGNLEENISEDLKKGNGIVHHNVKSMDISSSYPTVMLTKKFPMGIPTHYDEITESEFIRLTEFNCVMANFTFTDGCVAKEGIPDYYISASKTDILKNKLQAVLFNGRLFGTEVEFNYYCTEQDYFIVKEVYSWEPGSLKITDVYAFPAGYLPTDLIKAIVKFYKDKTELKGILLELVNYMTKKNMLNATYGMMVTDIVRDLIKYINDEYVTEIPDLDKAIEKYNKNKKRFLYYPWGIWVTAYARANLWSAILELKSDYIYSDTDSVKFLHPEKHEQFFEEYNNELWRLVERACRYHKIPIDDLRPISRGKQFPIGFWDDDGTYAEFKTLGAKRYFVRYDKPHMKISKRKLRSTEFHIKAIRKREGDWIARKAEIVAKTWYSVTVAGVGKKSSCVYLVKLGLENRRNPMDFFNLNLRVPPEYTSKLLITYPKDAETETDAECHEMLTDYLGVTAQVDELSFVHMEPKDYNLGQNEKFFEFLLLTEEWY